MGISEILNDLKVRMEGMKGSMEEIKAQLKDTEKKTEPPELFWKGTGQHIIRFFAPPMLFVL